MREAFDDIRVFPAEVTDKLKETADNAAQIFDRAGAAGVGGKRRDGEFVRRLPFGEEAVFVVKKHRPDVVPELTEAFGLVEQHPLRPADGDLRAEEYDGFVVINNSHDIIIPQAPVAQLDRAKHS